MTRESHWIAAGDIAGLPPGTARVVKHDGHAIALFRSLAGAVYAVDNACPHEGYPLAQGVVKDCVLTCAWHNYKFDLRDGSSVMGEEAVRSYPTRVASGVVEVDVTDPDPGELMPRLYRSLDQGMGEAQMGRVARDVVRLLAIGVAPEEILGYAAGFDAERAEYGSTHALPVAADALRYLPRNPGNAALLPLLQALDLASDASVRRPPRPRPAPTAPGRDPIAAGVRLRDLVEREDGASAEALLRGALMSGWARPELEPWFFRLCADHFLDFGHALIYTAKVFDFLDRVGWGRADLILGALLVNIVSATREDTLPGMAGLRRRLDAMEPRLAELYSSAATRTRSAAKRGPELRAAILDGDGAEMFASLTASLEEGASLEAIADALVLAAAERMLRFDPAHERSPDVQDNWLFVTHTLTHAAAVRVACRRFREPALLRLLFFAAHFIHRARPLDLPPARRSEPAPLASSVPLIELASAIAERDVERALGLVQGYLASDGPIEPLRLLLEDLALRAGGVRPIFTAHATKTTFVAFDEHTTLEGDPSRDRVLLALVRFLASPKVERSLERVAREAVGFVAGGRPPRVLAG